VKTNSMVEVGMCLESRWANKSDLQISARSMIEVEITVWEGYTANSLSGKGMT
jgi:hypothetical protein